VADVVTLPLDEDDEPPPPPPAQATMLKGMDAIAIYLNKREVIIFTLKNYKI
jgi:hypothetical protein